MKSRVGGSPAGYLIPGAEFDPAPAINTEEVSSGFGEGKKKSPQYTETPSLEGLQELFGLNRVVPEPSHIGPPPKPSSLEGALGGGSPGEAYLPMLQNAFSTKTGAESPSVEVQRMMDLLTGNRQASYGIRARSGRGGSR